MGARIKDGRPRGGKADPPRAREPRRRSACGARGLLSGAVLALVLAIAAFTSSASASLIAGTSLSASTGTSLNIPAGASQNARTDAGSTAPKVTLQPTNTTAEEGASASFTSTASNSPTVQWELSIDGGTSWQPIEGATATTYTVVVTSLAESGHEFRAVFTNASGSATSKAVTLTVTKKPAVTQQPVDANAREGHEASFEAHASGSPAPSTQWQSSTDGTTFKNLTGATGSVLRFTSVNKVQDGLKVRAVFKNSAGEAVSEAATLHVVELPVVASQPLRETVTEGEEATFRSSAHGNPTPTQQWEVSTDAGASWTPVPGATAETLTVPATTVAENGYRYRAIFTNVAGSVASESATLTVNGRPVVTLQPESHTVGVGGSATFEAAGTGTPSPTVQWESSSDEGASWAPISGATTDTLAVSNAQLSESGQEYRAVFKNVAGTAASEAAILTVSTDYRAYGWGLNSRGQAGVGNNTADITSPTPISGPTFVKAMAGGVRHSLALLAGGTVDAWGFNGHDQLGYEGPDSNSPVPVAHVSHVEAIAAGANHSVALLKNGTVEDWGNDESGQLGDGTTSEAELPVTVAGLSGVTAVAAGSEHTLALLSNGTVMAWGNDERGQLGNGSVKSSSTPVPVTGLSGVTAIAANRNFSLALLSNGSVKAWGDDEHGQLGNMEVLEGAQEEGSFSRTPVAVEGLTGVTAIAAGQLHALALLNDGTVVGWGDDREGELGNGTTEPLAVHPTPAIGLSNVVSIAAGESDSAAILASGRLMTWGMNNAGSLGLGTHGEAVDTPTLVSSLGMVAGVAAGGSQMLAFGEELPTVSSIAPTSGPTAGGTQVTITGTNLSGATAVRFGSSAATSLQVESATTVTAIAPPGTGTVDVTVTTPAGATPAVSGDRFTYLPAPVIGKLSAKGGPASGGTSLTITGTGLAGASEVRVGQAAATITADTATSMTVLTPQNDSGQLFVTVTTPGGTSATGSKAKFKSTPVIESVSPASGPLAGGTSVVITGAGFAPGTATTKLKFGSASSKSVQCSSTTSCTATVPAGRATGTVTVKASANKANSVATEGARYSYE
jgi:alpha-tubulin suppressor-like RCC1 family protein